MDRWSRGLLVVQGADYLVSAAWIVLGRESWLARHGVADGRMVDTHAAWMTVVGGILVFAGARERDARVLGAGAAAAMVAVNVAEAARHGLPPVYRSDLALQGAFLAAWLVLAVRGARTAGI
jgi:hypothetical protein